MAQFEIYKNPSLKTREAFPYIVDIQHSIINDLESRLVIPLGNRTITSNQAMKRLTPFIEYNGEQYLLITPQLTSMPKHLLKQPLGTIELQRHYIIDAIDFAIAGI
ncbi:MAG: CcdB family protein [Glaciecola sp.]|jgi:toxin CcdB|nr:CcdB family protein [Glaciecola sp.]MDG2099599.1 CcdB family protein [Glaciecola sp.]